VLDHAQSEVERFFTCVCVTRASKSRSRTCGEVPWQDECDQRGTRDHHERLAGQPRRQRQQQEEELKLPAVRSGGKG